MIPVLLFLLLVVWAAVLVPPWIRGRSGHYSPSASIAGFHRRLSVLANRSRDGRPLPGFAAPIPAIPPPARYSLQPGRLGPQPARYGPQPARYGQQQAPSHPASEAQRRRKQILEGLLIGLGCTFFLGFLTPLSFFRMLALLDLVALGGYVALLLQWKRNRLEHGQKVRPLPVRRPAGSFSQFPALERQAR